MDAPDPKKAVADFYAGRREAPAPRELSAAQRAVLEAGNEAHNLEEVKNRQGEALRDLLFERFADRIIPGESVLTTARRLLEESLELPVSEDWMETLSGHKFAPLSEDPQYSLKDLAWGAARACRFAGQISEEHEHYSVAEHLCLLYDHVWSRWSAETRQAVRDAVRRDDWQHPDLRLMRTLIAHDLQEGLVGDMVRPLKRQDPIYRRMEDKVCAHMAERWHLAFPLPPSVKELDNRILVDERAQALNQSGHEWVTDGLEPLGVKLQFWSPRRAYTELAARLYALGFDLEE